MMHSSPAPSPTSAKVAQGALSSAATSHSVAKPADELFGSVLVQQTQAKRTDAQQRTPDAASSKNSSAGIADQQRAAEPAVDESQNDAISARPANRPAADVDTEESADKETDTKAEDELLAPATILAAAPAAETLVPTESGKNLPVDGKNLPVNALLKPPFLKPPFLKPPFLKPEDNGNATTANAESGTVEAEAPAMLRMALSSHSGEAAFANTGHRDSKLASEVSTHSGDTTNGRSATSPQFADAFFISALQKNFEMTFGSGSGIASAIGSGISSATGSASNLESLSQLAGIEQAPESSTSVANPLILSGAEKLQALRPLHSLVPPSTALQINSQPGSPEWNAQVADSIRWMSKSDISVAELKLNPAELGSIEVRIFTEDQQTRVSIVTSQAATREIIESTLSKLREMLQSNGLQLEHSDVSHKSGSQAQSDRHARQEDSVSKDAFFNEHSGMQSHGLISRRADSGQIDHYV